MYPVAFNHFEMFGWVTPIENETYFTFDIDRHEFIAQILHLQTSEAKKYKQLDWPKFRKTNESYRKREEFELVIAILFLGDSIERRRYFLYGFPFSVLCSLKAFVLKHWNHFSDMLSDGAWSPKNLHL